MIMLPKTRNYSFDIQYLLAHREEFKNGNWYKPKWAVRIIDEGHICGSLQLSGSLTPGCLGELLSAFADVIGQRRPEIARTPSELYQLRLEITKAAESELIGSYCHGLNQLLT